MHVKNLVCEIGFSRKSPKKRIFLNCDEGRIELINNIEQFKILHQADGVLIAYEASGLGYVLHDKLEHAGYRSAVLAPTELLRSAKGYKKKTDKKIPVIYETIRGHVLQKTG
jgi:hypothetical protein